MDDSFEDLCVSPKYDCKNSWAYNEELIRIVKIKLKQANKFYDEIRADGESGEIEWGRVVAFELVLDLLDGKKV